MCYHGCMPSPVELLRDRLKAFLVFIKPKLLVEGAHLDRITRLRRLSDVRLRSFAVGRPVITGADLCGLLADERSGRFDEAAVATGLVPASYFGEALMPLGEDMALMTEACLVLQVVGPPVLARYAKEFVAQKGALKAGYLAPPTPKSLPSAGPPLPEPVAKLLGGVTDLWSIPAHTHKILEMLGAPETPPEAVCAEIEKDPGLSAQCLRVVNSSTYGLGSRIASIKRAVVTLGYPLTRRIVSVSALTSRLGRPHGDLDFSLRDYWRHSLGVAHGAQLVAAASRRGNPDEHFTAGLLHAVGKLAEYQHLRSQFRLILAECRATGAPWSEVERRLLGTTYAEIGACLCERWRFPALIVDAARRHLEPMETLAAEGAAREPLVVAGLVALLKAPGDRALHAAWSGPLRVPEDRIPGLLEQAAGLAAGGVSELSAA